MKKKDASIVLFAVMIGLGFYALANIISSGITLAKLMSLAGLVVVAVFVERRCSHNVGVRLALEIGRDVLGGLGSLALLGFMPFQIPEGISVITMFAVTAILGVTMSDDDMSGAEKK